MAVSTKSGGKAGRAGPTWIAPIEVPRELVEALAYQKFEQRGRMNGRDWADWFEAENELKALFRSVHWATEYGGTPPCLTLRASGPAHAIQTLCRYFQWRPDTTSIVGGEAARLRVVWPDDVDHNPDETRVGQTMKLDRINSATPEQLQRATTARSPVSFLSQEDFAGLKGRLVALLLAGPEKGKVIASAPLDHDHPETARRSIKDQVAASPYKNRRYQLRQVLDGTLTD